MTLQLVLPVFWETRHRWDLTGAAHRTASPQVEELMPAKERCAALSHQPPAPCVQPARGQGENRLQASLANLSRIKALGTFIHPLRAAATSGRSMEEGCLE